MTDLAYPDALPPRYALHWYVLEKVLGQGGFGITYLARDTNLDQPVAIKEYLPVEVATRRPDASVRSRTEDQQERYRWGLDRFIKEARTLARFDHPNIVRVHSVFEHNGTAYMVMRLEEGATLESMLERRRTLPEAELVRVLLPVLDGLEKVHDAGFIHRDIKPDNILIRADGTPVLLDFGSARHALGQARTVTILVAPGYAPFEQYYSNGESQGPWTDIYGLGATCYRAIAGAPPMDAIARSKGILGSTRELLVPARAVGSGRYSETLLKAVDHALEFAERDRPQSIAEWRREIMAQGAGAAAPAAGQAAPQATPAVAPSDAPAKRPFARLAATGAAIVGIAAIGGGIGAYVMMRGTQPQPEPAAPPQIASAPDAEAEQRKVQEEQLAKKRAEQERLAREAVEQERLARLKAEEESLARQKAEEERVAKEKAALDKRLAAQKLEQERLAKVKVAAQTPAAPAPVATSAPTPAQAAATAPPKGDAAAFVYYRGLAHRGDADAALRLGELYEAGRGTAPSNNWAYTWYAVAELRGAAGAKARRDAVAKKLQPKEIEQADRLSKGLARPAN